MSRAIVAALCTPVLLLSAQPAHGADDPGLSWDGTAWTDELSAPLFTPHRRWVPGDVDVASFSLRNRSGTGAVLTVTVRTPDADGLFTQRDVALEARLGGGRWLPLANGTPSAPLGADLPAGGSARVDVRATFGEDAGNGSQSARLPLRLLVTLSEAPDSNDLPLTGSSVPSWLVPLGAALVGAGLALVAVRRGGETADG